MYSIVLVLAITTLITSQQPTCNLGCVQCDSNSGVCFACGNGYELTLQGQCVLAKINSCSLYLNQQQCIQCYPTYSLVNNTCQRDFSGCLQNISLVRCGRCIAQLANEKGVCVGVYNCQVYAARSCSKCQNGFTLKNSVCMSNAENCQLADIGTGICQKCAANFSLVGYKCVSIKINSENCYLYDEKGSCYACKRGYILNGTLCNLQNQLGNVQVVTVVASPPPPAANVQNNFKNNNDQANLPGGVKVLTNNTNSNLQNGGGAGVTPPTPTPITPQSPNNSSVTSNLNTVMTKLNIYCSKFQNGTCITCYTSFYLKNGTCTQVPPLCQKFNYKTTICEGCYRGYELNSNAVCVVSVASQKDPNCKTYNNDSKCIECYPKFILSSLSVCQPSNPLCKQLNGDGSCKICFDGYVPSGISCAISSNNIVMQSDPFCLTKVDKNCTSCVNGYYVQSKSGKCVPLSLNCLTNDLQTGLCTQCLPLLLLVNGSCIIPIDKCVQYNSNNSCIQCSSQSYFLKNGLCYNKDVTCAQYDDQGNCKSCVTTYYLIGGACIFPALGLDPLCINYVNGYCTACKMGSYLNNFICQQIDKNCSEFNYDKSFCIKCSQGYLPQGAGCILM